MSDVYVRFTRFPNRKSILLLFAIPGQEILIQCFTHIFFIFSESLSQFPAVTNVSRRQLSDSSLYVPFLNDLQSQLQSMIT